MRSTGSTRFALGTAVTGLCLGSRGRGESTNRLDLRKEDEACCISLENEKPADLSFACFQGEAWRVCHHYSDGIPASCQVFCPAIARIEWTRERLRNPLVLVGYNNNGRCKPPLSPRFSARFCLPPVMVQFD